MKRTLIIPATIALLTGMAATAQETNAADMDVNASADMEMTADAENIDDLSIDELNALQLKVLKDPAASDATSDTLFTVQSDMETSASSGADDAGAMMMAEADTALPAEAGTEVKESGDLTEADVMTDPAMQDTIADVAGQDPRFTTLVALVTQAGLAETLDGETDYTVFAPTNAAFEALDPDLVAKLASGEADDRLATILKAHIVEGTTLSNDLAEGETTVTTLAGSEMTLTKTEDGVTIGEAAVVEADIDASNGVIHAIDRVIVPNDAS